MACGAVVSFCPASTSASPPEETRAKPLSMTHSPPRRPRWPPALKASSFRANTPRCAWPISKRPAKLSASLVSKPPVGALLICAAMCYLTPHPGPTPALPLNVKSEFRIPKPERSPDSEIRRARISDGLRSSAFGLRISFGFRASEFGFQVQGFNGRKFDSQNSLLVEGRGSREASWSGTGQRRAASSSFLRPGTLQSDRGKCVCPNLAARRAPSPLKGERAGVRGEAVRLASPPQTKQCAHPSSMHAKVVLRIWLALVLFASARGAEAPAQTSAADPARQLREYRDYAMGHDGNVARGRELFLDEQRAACAKCHTVDGSSAKAGPDLFAVGDKFPRRELILAVLEPSAAIAIGYGTTIVETKSGEVYQGILKQTTADALELMGADGKSIRIATADIKEQRGSTLSLMPDGLQSGLSQQEFADLIEYLVTLKQPDSALTSHRGMPVDIPELAKPIAVRPFFSEELRFPHAFVHKPGDVRSGLVWFGQIPGISNAFLVVHQTGKIWLLEKRATNDVKTLFADVSKDLFNERGPNGLLSLAFHPKFRENRQYYLKHQVFEEGKIATTVVERRAAPDLRGDSGQPSRRLNKIVSATQDHSGGCIGFDPDGFLYIAMGDTGPQQDPQGHSQDLTTHLGKILRIDVDHTDAGLPYAIPADNPFRGRSDARPEIWAYGFREPWRFSFDPVTHELWVGDVGQDRVEEVTIVRRGENHGWNVFEGFEPFSNRYRKEGVTFVPPVFAYRRKYGNSITGGYVYRGEKASSFYGVYICGDYTSHRIFGLKQQDRTLQIVRQIGTAPQGISSFATDERGEIYVVGYEGMIYRLDFTGTAFDAPAEASVASPGTRIVQDIDSPPNRF